MEGLNALSRRAHYDHFATSPRGTALEAGRASIPVPTGAGHSMTLRRPETPGGPGFPCRLTGFLVYEWPA